MSLASIDEQNDLAERVGTTRGNLYQYAGGHRNASAERAGEIERVTSEMHKSSKGRLPKIYRTDLAAACKACPFAQKCLGTKSEFPLIG